MDQLNDDRSHLAQRNQQLTDEFQQLQQLSQSQSDELKQQREQYQQQVQQLQQAQQTIGDLKSELNRIKEEHETALAEVWNEKFISNGWVFTYSLTHSLTFHR